jgi:hypothetical protein
MKRSQSVHKRKAFWKEHRDPSPVHCPYFYDSQGHIQKSNNSEALLQVKYSLVPPATPSPCIPGLVPAPQHAKRPPSRPRRRPTATRTSFPVYGIQREVFIMENGVEVAECQRFPGFRYLLIDGPLASHSFWRACRTHLTPRNYKYIVLSDGALLRSPEEIPETAKLVFVSDSLPFKGVHFRPDYDPNWSLNTSFATACIPLRSRHSLLVTSFSTSPLRTYSVKDMLAAQKR